MKFLTAALFLFASFHSPAFAHEEEYRIAMEAESTAPILTPEHEFRFQLVDTKTKTLVTESDVVIGHEKKLHFVAYDTALKEFQHVHPEFDGEFWHVKLSFNRSGKYWLWAQGILKSDNEEFSTPAQLSVNLASKPGWPLPPRLADSRAGTDGVSKATLSNTKLFANKMAMITVKFSRTDGSLPQITPYLGAFAHVIAVSDDADTMVHIHPMDGGKPEEGMLHTTFPRKGLFRLWVQYVDGGQIKVIPLAVQVF